MKPVPITRSLKVHIASQSGVSLVVVLWVLALLMIMATELVYTVRVDSMTAANFRDEAEAEALAAAGINMGIAEVASPYKFVVLDKEGKLKFIREGMDEAQQSRALDLGAGMVQYVIEDESGKLNLNTSTREVISNLFKISGVQGSELDIIADSIIDWRDENHEYHLNGAEDDYYMSLPRPYGAKDAPFDTVEELLLVKGMSPDIFYGSGKFGADLDKNEALVSEFKGVAGQLTVWGDGKININTAGKEVLKAVLGEGRAQEILLRRETEGYFNLPYFGGTVSSSVFSIISAGTVRGLTVKIRATVEKKNNGVKISYWNEGISG